MSKEVKKGLFLVMLLSFTILLAACGSSSQTEDSAQNQDSSGEQVTGGTLNIAIDAAPPTLDQPTSTAVSSRDTSRLIFETLVTTNSNFEPVPMLAESIDTEDNKIYTIKLREGILFHNGEEMTSEDVVASMERWLEKSGITGQVFEGATWIAEDEYTVILELQEASSLTLDTMASAKQAAAIMPKEVIENAPSEGVEEYIGTGPFKFVEWRQDQFIHFEKYEGYVPVEFEADGLSGKKEALVDEIFVHIVPDTSTRIAGLQTGQYDFIYNVPFDYYDQLENDANLDTILTPNANELLGFNKVNGIASDPLIRQAVNAALDVNAIMFAAFPNEDFYWLDSGYMDVNIKNWASTAGSEYYNQADSEKAKQLLEEAGYNGEPFRVMTTRDYDHHYNVGVVVQEQLKKIGMNAVLDVYDWPTLLDLRENDLGAWDAFATSSSTVSTPPQLLALSPTWAGGVQDDYVIDLMTQLEFAPTTEEAQALWDELQLYAWEELVPIVNLGGYNSLFGHSAKVQGITTNTGPIFWNVSKVE